MANLAYGAARQAVLEAAVRIVASQGLRGLTYRSVAAEAGVTHGIIRYHFGDWNTLVEEALVYSTERSIAGSELEGTDSLESFAAALATLVTSDPETQAFQYELALEARRRTELLPALERAYDSYRDAVRNALSHHGIDDPELTDVVFATLDGLVFQQTVFGRPERTRAALVFLRRLVGTYAATTV